MGPAGADRSGGSARAEVDRGDRSGGLVVSDVLGVPIAERARVVFAPAADLAVVQEGAGVIVPGADGRCEAAGAQVHGADRARALVDAHRLVAAVAEPPTVAVAPAAHVAVVEESTCVTATGGDGPRGAARAEIHRRHGPGDLVVADVAEVLEAGELPLAP